MIVLKTIEINMAVKLKYIVWSKCAMDVRTYIHGSHIFMIWHDSKKRKFAEE